MTRTFFRKKRSLSVFPPPTRLPVMAGTRKRLLPWWMKGSAFLAIVALAGALGLWWAHSRAQRAWQAHKDLLASQGDSIDWRDFEEMQADLTSSSILNDRSRLEALLPDNSVRGWNLPEDYRGWRSGQTYPFHRVYLPKRSQGVHHSREESLRVLEASYHAPYDRWTSAFLDQSGVEHDFIHLPEHGIRGNGHIVMLELNNHEVADLVIAWLDEKLHR